MGKTLALRAHVVQRLGWTKEVALGFPRYSRVSPDPACFSGLGGGRPDGGLRFSRVALSEAPLVRRDRQNSGQAVLFFIGV